MSPSPPEVTSLRHVGRKALPPIDDISISDIPIPNSVHFLACPSRSVWLGDPTRPWLVAKGRGCTCNHGACKGGTKKARDKTWPEQAVRQWMVAQGVSQVVPM